jgi:winged helix DNA-binding protein
VTTPHEVALLRLVAQRIAGPPHDSAADTVRWLTAVQAQDHPGALTSVALRTRDGTRDGVVAALDAGEVVRSWPMRGTLHLVAADDLGWLLELCGPRVLAGAASRRARLGLTDADIERARELAVDALTGGRRLTRAELLAAIGKGVDVAGQRGYHLLWYLAQTGTLVLGPTDGAEQLWVLTGEWVAAARRPAREEALAELALRFFAGHGPATVADLARWAGLRVTDARAGLAQVRDRLAEVDVDGTTHWMDPETPDLLAACRARARGVFLLPGFDEFVLGYADRSCAVPPEFADRIVTGGNGMFRATVVADGRVVGTWRRTGSGGRRSLTAEPFTSFPEGVERAIEELAAALP